MRILIVNSQRGVVGGVEKYLRSLTCELEGRGHRLAFAYEHDAQLHEDRVDSDNWSSWRINESNLGQIFSQIQAWRPSCVFVHGCRCLEFEARVTQLYPSYLYAHDHQRTCPTGKRTFTLPNVEPCSRKAGSMCLACYFPRRCGGLNPITALRCYSDWRTAWAQIHGYSKVFVASSAMRKLMLDQGMRDERLSVLPPANAEVVVDRSKPEPRRFTNRITFLGRLVAEKGAEHLIRAIPIISEKLSRDLELVIAGEGPERPKLERMARATRLPIRLVGWLDAGQRVSLLRSSDLLVLPSVWPEPFGMVGIEAGALGTPSVAFPLGGVVDWLQPGVSGEFATTGCSPHLGITAGSVRALVSESHYQTLREGAWKQARQYLVSQHVDQLEAEWADIAMQMQPATCALSN